MIKYLFRFLAVLLALWCSGFVLYLSWILHLKPYEGTAEGIVVVTGGEHRVETGLKLLAQDRARHILISGVNKQVKKAELLALHHQDKKLADRIDLGFVALDTLGNADEAAAWAQQKNIHSLIVVTSHYHMPRTLMHLGVVLPDIALYAYPVKPDIFVSDDWYRSREAWRLLVSDYNKVLLTYPKILLFKGEIK